MAAWLPSSQATRRSCPPSDRGRPGDGGLAVTRKRWTLLVSCAAALVLLLDVAIVIVALPDIQHGVRSSCATRGGW